MQQTHTPADVLGGLNRRIAAMREGLAEIEASGEFESLPYIYRDVITQLEAQRDAVAELIRVAQGVLDDMNSVAPRYRAQQSVDELTAALARVGGAS